VNSKYLKFFYRRHISGPHICGDAIDIDVKNNHLVTGSWRKYSALQVINF
jgi:COMPASS component SWD3